MTTDLRTIKQRYGIIGFDPALDRAIEVAEQVAKTDLSVLITGESGVGKENFPRIIHDYSARKNGAYIAVNCGAIPEGTIDSELFGHEKGAFTGAVEARKGYFEVADGGTIFLDEVADLPLSTQVRLLRVLENGEFIRVGASKPMRTSVRVVAATNVDIADRIAKGKFREDLFYRLNSVPIHVPALRERKDDIFPLFMKFATDFSVKYHFPPISLDEDARAHLANYSWPGNVRQLKHVTEQISLLEKDRNITAVRLAHYLTAPQGSNLPALVRNEKDADLKLKVDFMFQLITEQQKKIGELQNTVNSLLKGKMSTANAESIEEFSLPNNDLDYEILPAENPKVRSEEPDYGDAVEFEDGDLSVENAEKNAIKAALDRHKNNRKLAAADLKISERTLYRKIKEYGL